MIRLRDDDVLLRSKGWEDPFGRFKQVHEWARLSDQILHVPSLLVEEIREHFPHAAEYIRTETRSGRMAPQFHGMFHIDYAALPVEHVLEHLTEGAEWMEDAIGVRPTKWYTPWGANAEHLYKAAAEASMDLVDCSEIYTIQRCTRELREGTVTVDQIKDREIFLHWWEAGLRVKRLAYALNHGSWQAAADVHRELFGE